MLLLEDHFLFYSSSSYYRVIMSLKKVYWIIVIFCSVIPVTFRCKPSLSPQKNWRKGALPIQIYLYVLSTDYVEGIGLAAVGTEMDRAGSALSLLQSISEKILES